MCPFIDQTFACTLRIIKRSYDVGHNADRCDFAHSAVYAAKDTVSRTHDLMERLRLPFDRRHERTGGSGCHRDLCRAFLDYANEFSLIFSSK